MQHCLPLRIRLFPAPIGPSKGGYGVGHSKLNPHSTPSPARESEDPPHSLSRDDDAAGGVSKRRRLERSRRPRRHKLGPIQTASPDTVEVRRSQRGARRRRATLSLSNGGGSSLPRSETPGNSCIVTCAKNRASERAAGRSLSSLRKMPGGFWRPMGSDPTCSGTPSIITDSRIVQRTTRSPDA